MALQCPRCPLRFDLAPMLADHLATDHHVGPEMTDPLQPPAQRIGLVDPDRADRPRRPSGSGHPSDGERP